MDKFQEFKEEIFKKISFLPEHWRKGQKVFNYIDKNYHVARKVQFDDGIDCFYNDETIEPFIEASYKYLNNNR